MNTLSIKLPARLDAELLDASQRQCLSKSELVRRAIVAYIAADDQRPRAESALSMAGNLVGCFSGGPPDLSSNPKHLDVIGTVRRNMPNLPG